MVSSSFLVSELSSLGYVTYSDGAVRLTKDGREYVSNIKPSIKAIEMELDLPENRSSLGSKKIAEKFKPELVGAHYPWA